MRAIREQLSTNDFDYLNVSVTSSHFNWHYHSKYELMLIVRGTGMRYVGDSVDSFGSGDVTLLGPNVAHTWASDTEGSVGIKALVIHFERRYLGDELLARPEAQEVDDLLSRSRRALGFPPSQRVTDFIAAMETVSGLRRVLLLTETLLELSEVGGTPLCSAAFTRLPQELARRRIDNVCQFLHQSCTRHVSISEAAEVAHMTPDSFSRFFRHAMGRSFTDYLNELRVGRACALLSDTDLPVGSIAAESGFTNLANFNRRFKERKAMTPRSYRNQFARERDSGHRAPAHSPLAAGA